MTLTINDTTMTSDQTAHTARQAPGRQHGWEVSWLPGQVLDRNTAITAMILADIAGEGDLHEGHRLWPHIQSWAAELGLTGPDAIARPPSRPATSILSRNQPADSRTGRQPTDQPARHSIQIGKQQRGTRLPAARGRIAARPVPVRAPHRPGHRRRRRPGPHRRSCHRPAAGHLAGRPAASTGLRPGPGPLRPAPERSPPRSRPSCASTPAPAPTRTGRRPPGSLDYCTSRGAALGPVGENFGAACDQIDRADLMLADLHERARHGLAQPGAGLARDRRTPDHRPGRPRPREPDGQPHPGRHHRQHRHLRHRRARRRARGPRPRSRAVRPEPARRLLRPAQPPGHRRPRDPGRHPAARRRARLPHGHRARQHVQPPEPTRTLRSMDHVADRQIDLEAEP